jgi:hypothetical protein
MWNNKFLAALILVVVFTSPRAALAYAIQGAGATSCAEFAKIYQVDPQIEDAFFDWALGFMSAMNASVMVRDKPPRELAGVLVDQKRALRSYCANNPLKNYMDGVMEFYGKLRFIPTNSN